MRLVTRYFVSLSLLLFCWWLVVVVFDIPSYICPPPSKVFIEIKSNFDLYFSATLWTSKNFILGFFFGVFFGVFWAVLLHSSKVLKYVLEPLLTVFQSFPRESLFPLFVMWFGFGSQSKVFGAFLLCFFATTMLMLGALDKQKTEFSEIINTLELGRLAALFHVQIPASIPDLMTILKLVFPLSMIGAVVTEFMGGQGGLGHIIISSSSNFSAEPVYASICCMAAVGIFFFGMLSLAERPVNTRFLGLEVK